MHGTAQSQKGSPELVDRFRELTLLLYDTRVGLKTLEDRVHPFLAEEIEFKDPLIHGRGVRQFKVALRGFHSLIHFDFDITQIDVQSNASGDGGRALVDGVMNLRQLHPYVYPLRTVLVYDFVTSKTGSGLQIVRLEEIWSLGDLVENAPLISGLYRAARTVNGYVLSGLFWLGCLVKPRA